MYVCMYVHIYIQSHTYITTERAKTNYFLSLTKEMVHTCCLA